MHTEIKKTYRWGFALTEQDLRRTVQVAHDSLKKVPGEGTPNFSVQIKLKDGSIVNTTIFDDVFILENSGEKLIQAVGLHWKLGTDEAPHKIDIEFRVGSKNEDSWNSIVYSVYGTTRDWAFITAAEIDERVKRTKLIAWEAVLSSKWIFPILIFLTTFGMAGISMYYTPQDQYHVALEKLYISGQLKDPIVALIKLEQLRSERNPIAGFVPVICMYTSMGELFAILFYVLPKISPSYNFCWGDYLQKYARSRQLRSAFWTLVVLATVISIVANYFSKKLGI